MPNVRDSVTRPIEPDRQQQMSDHELVAAIRLGSEALFEQVMRRYNQRLFRLARSILRDDGEAEEAVQETYVKGFFRLGEFRGANSLGAWLARICQNEALTRRRKAEHGVRRMDADELERAASRADDADSPAPEDSTQQAQLKALLEAAIDELPEPLRMAFVLREVEQLSVRETADCLDIPPATVKTRIFRARRHLRRSLGRRVAGAVKDAFSFAGARCDRIVAGSLERIASLSTSTLSGDLQ
jgi:RNA polymerase sigma-70 factor (ECF subfamily)